LLGSHNEYKLTERQFDFDYQEDKTRLSACRFVAATSSSLARLGFAIKAFDQWRN